MAEEKEIQYENEYIVTGGAFLDPSVFDNIGDALLEFSKRIILTKPFTDSVVEIEYYKRLGDLIVETKLVHRVKLF